MRSNFAVALLLCTMTSSFTSSCPSECTGCTDGGPRIRVACTGVTAFPQRIPNATKILRIWNSRLDFIPLNTFVNLSELEVLYLDDVSLRMIHGDALSPLAELRILSLRYNKLRDIPSLSNLTKLVRLNLAHNDIGYVSKNSFAGAPNLKTLVLDHNRMRFLNHDTFL